MPYFTHLHLHTRYSVLDGASKISDLMKKAKAFGMDAMAITDHGNMYGVMEFVTEAKKAGIKPIVGCEVYVAPKSRFEKVGGEGKNSYHLILLAKNPTGYHNLVKLCSFSQRKEAFYYKPRIDHELLQQYHEGLICCSACLGGEVPQAIMSGEDNWLRETIKFYHNLFGEDYYLEMQMHGHPQQMEVNKRLAELAAEYNIKCIATNDVHFVEAEHYEAHKVLICLNTGHKLNEETKMVYTGQEYFKSGDEMAALFPDHPEYLENTREITEKIETYELTHEILLPKFTLPEPFVSEMEYLRHLTYEGAKKRYGEDFEQDKNIKERIDFELDTIERMGFPGYFLIVWDFIRKAREMGVLVGPGRGSAAGSAIAYCIGITNVDPIKYDLLFERFLNPGRISMPDIDVDFDDIGRERVIEYVKDKYGSERVSQIITYGTMAAKSSIKDAARVLDLPLPESNRLAGLVPDTPNISLEKAFKEVPQLQEEMEKNPNELVRKTLKYARELEGCIRSVGVHACGMIIAPEDLVEYVPTGVSKDSEMPVTQYEGTYVESVGLLKMDFLGLKTLTIIKDALDNIRLRHGIDIDIDHIPLDDAATYDLFGRGETNGIFQFESDGMKKYMRDLKPNRLEDIIAMNALYRPGPMKYIPQFIDRKFGREKIAYDIPDMEEYLKDTYGITVYQEQVMLLSQKLADFSKSDADTLRKAMGKKKLDVLAKMKAHFMEGCEKHQYSAEICEKIWTDWEDFASYAFNKSHATCYAWVAYQTAYLKAHYPAEFMASVLTNNLSDITKISFYMEECRRMKINILGPDVNESFTGFTVNKDGAIRFGLSGIKNVGTAVVDLLVKERNENGPYKDVMNFVQRSDLRALNRRCMESLVKAGGFDGLGGITRAAFFARQKPDGPDFIDKLLQYAAQYQRNKNSSQTDLFGEAQSDEVAEIDIPDTTPWSAIEQLNNEKEVVGMFISGHPLQTYQLELDTFSNTNLGVLSHQEDWERFKNRKLEFGAVVTSARELMTKTGKPYGRFMLEDFNESFELVLFGEDHMRFKDLLRPQTFVFISVEMRYKWGREQNGLELGVTNVTLLNELMDKRTKIVNIEFDLPDLSPAFTERIGALCKEYQLTDKVAQKGAAVNFRVRDPKSSLYLNMPLNKHVRASEFIPALRSSGLTFEIKLG